VALVPAEARNLLATVDKSTIADQHDASRSEWSVCQALSTFTIDDEGGSS